MLFQLEEVMETETYKNAKLILERFDPDSKKKMVSVPFLHNFSFGSVSSIKKHVHMLFCYVNEGTGINSNQSSDVSQIRTRYQLVLNVTALF